MSRMAPPFSTGPGVDVGPAFGSAAAAPPNYGGVEQGYGGAAMPPPQLSSGGGGKGLFLRYRRRRMNLPAIIACLVLPWGLFTAIYALQSFSIHYQQPSLCTLLTVLGLLAAVVVGLYTAGQRSSSYFSNAEREPTWLIFLTASLFVAWATAYCFGSSNFSSHMRPYYDALNLNNYTGIDPTRMRGQQLMDAGQVRFIPGTKLDITKSMGFKNSRTYCVAPIVVGKDELVTYDFWAVGSDCCSGNQANFHCGHFNDPRANGGLRLMSDGDRAMYRLAVQQAEATYKIKAVHPLFFEWVAEPLDLVMSWKSAGQGEFLVYTLAYLVFQVFLVVTASLAFSKIGGQ